MSNVSSNDLKYGFFNSLEIEETDPETGETTTTYDRLYNAETFNRYFENIVLHTGVFAYSGMTHAAAENPNIGTNAFKATSSTSVYGVDIAPGKALINGFWVELLNTVSIPLQKSSSPSDHYRRHMVVIRWYSEEYPDESLQRTFDIVVVDGPTSSTWPGVSMNPHGNNLVIKGTFPYFSGNIDTSDGYVDLPLCEVISDSADGNTLPSTGGRIVSRIGTNGCPYISHLVVGPSQADFDAIVSGYLNSIRAFSDTLQGELSVDTKIVSKDFPFTGDGTWTEVEFDPSQVGGFEYSNTDIYEVYYNGLRLMDSEWTKTYSQTSGMVTIALNRSTRVPKGNTVVVRVLKSFVGEFPFMNGDELSY